MHTVYEKKGSQEKHSHRVYLYMVRALETARDPRCSGVNLSRSPPSITSAVSIIHCTRRSASGQFFPRSVNFSLVQEFFGAATILEPGIPLSIDFHLIRWPGGSYADYTFERARLCIDGQRANMRDDTLATFNEPSTAQNARMNGGSSLRDGVGASLSHRTAAAFVIC